jgi:hypothetical protein
MELDDNLGSGDKNKYAEDQRIWVWVDDYSGFANWINYVDQK